jgi:hypothetical protein
VLNLRKIEDERSQISFCRCPSDTFKRCVRIPLRLLNLPLDEIKRSSIEEKNNYPLHQAATKSVSITHHSFCEKDSVRDENIQKLSAIESEEIHTVSPRQVHTEDISPVLSNPDYKTNLPDYSAAWRRIFRRKLAFICRTQSCPFTLRFSTPSQALCRKSPCNSQATRQAISNEDSGHVI